MLATYAPNTVYSKMNQPITHKRNICKNIEIYPIYNTTQYRGSHGHTWKNRWNKRNRGRSQTQWTNLIQTLTDWAFVECMKMAQNWDQWRTLISEVMEDRGHKASLEGNWNHWWWWGHKEGFELNQFLRWHNVYAD